MSEEKNTGGEEKNENKNLTDKNEERTEDVTNETEERAESPEEEQKKKTQNLISLVIILLGVAVGSFFVDIAQYVSGNGYSKHALEDAEVFVLGDRTWVAFEDPAVEVMALTTSEEDFEDCPSCDPKEVLDWMKRFIPTLVSKKVDIDSAEGKALIEKHKIKTIPSFIFSNEIEKASFFEGEAKILFEKKEDDYMLNAAGIGIPVGKYLETPEVRETDPVLGNKDAEVKIIVFSDFQCPYCGQYYEEVTKIAEEFGDQVALTYKDMPLSFHPQAIDAALAARCANEQEKFWEMADLLYANQKEWGTEDVSAVLKRYASRLGLNRTKFDDCLDNEKFKDDVIADFEEASVFGVTGTPSTFINDEFMNGMVPEESLREAIQDAMGEASEEATSEEVEEAEVETEEVTEPEAAQEKEEEEEVPVVIQEMLNEQTETQE